MKKKIAAILLVLLTVFVCISCSDDEITDPASGANVDHTPQSSAADITVPDILPSSDETDDEKQDENLPEEIKNNVVLYFTNEDVSGLVKTEREITYLSDISLYEAVINELFKGPSDEKLTPVLEGEDLLNSVSLDEDGLLTVDFKYDFITLNSGGSTQVEFAKYAIANTLCSIEGINAVKINIDGSVDCIFGNDTLESALSFREEMIANK